MSNELDKKFSSELRGYESPVDAEALWQAVQPSRRRRRLGWLWFLLGGFFLGASAWWMTNTENETAFAETNTAPVGIHTPIAANTTVDSSVASNTAKIATPEQSLIADQQSVSSLANNSTAFAETGTHSNAMTLVSPSEKATADLTPMKAGQSDETTTASESLATHEQSIAPPAATNKNTASAENTTSENLKEVTTSTAEANKQTAVEANETASPARRTLPIALLDAGVSRMPDDLSPIHTINCGTNDLGSNASGSPWFAQADASYYRLNRRLEIHDSFDLEWPSRRRESERPLEAVSLDLSIGYRLNKRWELRAGVGYTQIAIEFAQQRVSSQIDSVEGIRSITVFPDNTVDTTFGIIEVEITENFRKRTYNSFRQWELPLMASYNFGKNKLYLQAEAGVRLQFRREWEGEILNAAGRYENWANQDWYKSGFDLSIQAGLKAAYELSPRTTVFAGVSARYYPQTFTKADTPFEENYQLLGGSLGLRRSF